MNVQDILDNLLWEAIDLAIIEANATPLEVGTRVGQLDIDKFGAEPAILMKITEDGLIVERDGDGQEIIWPVTNTVSVERVNVLYNELMEEASKHLRVLQMLSDFVDCGSDDEIGGAKIPTPGCTCPHCETFSAEEHAEAAKLQAERNAVTAE